VDPERARRGFASADMRECVPPARLGYCWTTTGPMDQEDIDRLGGQRVSEVAAPLMIEFGERLGSTSTRTTG
jgi:hypothetical protein